jgi:hypothetical protein
MHKSIDRIIQEFTTSLFLPHLELEPQLRNWESKSGRFQRRLSRLERYRICRVLSLGLRHLAAVLHQDSLAGDGKLVSLNYKRMLDSVQFAPYDFIPKPFQHRLLATTLSQCLARHSVPVESAAGMVGIPT